MNDKELEKMAFLERCLHCLHVVGERIEVGSLHSLLWINTYMKIISQEEHHWTLPRN